MAQQTGILLAEMPVIGGYMENTRYYKGKLSKEEQRIYEILLQGLNNHLDIIVIPTNMPEENAGEIVNAVDFDNPQLYYVNFEDLGIQVVDEPGFPDAGASTDRII